MGSARDVYDDARMELDEQVQRLVPDEHDSAVEKRYDDAGNGDDDDDDDIQDKLFDLEINQCNLHLRQIYCFQLLSLYVNQIYLQQSSICLLKI